MRSIYTLALKNYLFKFVASTPLLFPFFIYFGEPFRIAYSNWSGFFAWQIAIEKDWIKEAGVDVKFDWFECDASMEAITAGKMDTVLVTIGDALLTNARGV